MAAVARSALRSDVSRAVVRMAEIPSFRIDHDITRRTVNDLAGVKATLPPRPCPVMGGVVATLTARATRPLVCPGMLGAVPGAMGHQDGAPGGGTPTHPTHLPNASAPEPPMVLIGVCDVGAGAREGAGHEYAPRIRQ